MTWMGTAFRSAFGVAWRHRWTYAVPVATLLLPATLYAVRLPDLFRARAVVFARPLEGAHVGGSLPTERAAQTYELVQTSRDRLLTNANASPVVPLLYPGHAANDPWALQAVKGRIQWDRAGDSAFAVALEDVSPKVAADAVNAMIRAFQESERGRKVADAEGPLHSFESQLAAAKERSDAASRAVDEFRGQNDGVLPEQESTITQELTQLRSEITWQEQSANSARQRAQFLAEQVSRWSAAAATDTPGRKASADEDKLDSQLKEQQKSADDVRKRLVEEETLRTDKHPSVQALRRQLQILEGDVEKTVKALDGARRAAQATASKQHQEQTRSAVDDLKSMRAQAEQDEKAAGEAAKELRGRMQALHTRLGRIPGVRPKLLELIRRAEEEGKRAAALDAYVISAQSVVDHLRGDPNNVTGYRVDEWAIAPVLPSGPARWKYLAVAVGLGLVIGYGARSLRKRYEQPPLAQPHELRELLPGALVVTVPLLAEGRRPQRRLAFREIALGLWVCVAIGTSALALAARKGIVTPPEWLRPIVGGRA